MHRGWIGAGIGALLFATAHWWIGILIYIFVGLDSLSMAGLGEAPLWLQQTIGLISLAALVIVLVQWLLKRGRRA
jgi:hypothetical protein